MSLPSGPSTWYGVQSNFTSFNFIPHLISFPFCGPLVQSSFTTLITACCVCLDLWTWSLLLKKWSALKALKLCHFSLTLIHALLNEYLSTKFCWTSKQIPKISFELFCFKGEWIFTPGQKMKKISPRSQWIRACEYGADLQHLMLKCSPLQ